MAQKNLSALKRVRQSEKRRIRNQAWRSKMKTYVRKVESALASNDVDTARLLLREADHVMSRAVSKGVIHKNTAARRISRLAKKVDTSIKSSAVS